MVNERFPIFHKIGVSNFNRKNAGHKYVKYLMEKSILLFSYKSENDVGSWHPFKLNFISVRRVFF